MALRLLRMAVEMELTCRWADVTTSNRTPPTKASQRQTKTVFEKEWSFLPPMQNQFTLKKGIQIHFHADS
jgi:hypothetical protein